MVVVGGHVFFVNPRGPVHEEFGGYFLVAVDGYAVVKQIQTALYHSINIQSVEDCLVGHIFAFFQRIVKPDGFSVDGCQF